MPKLNDNETPNWNEHGITNQQEDFLQNYVSNGFNAKRAAIDAGYSEKSAHSTAYITLKKPKVKARLKTIMEDRDAHYQLSKEDLVRRYTVLEEMYEELLYLSMLDRELTDTEQAKFKRLADVIKTSDIIKSRSFVATIKGILNNLNDDEDDQIQINLNI